jgi:hypothetical protein
MLTGAVPTDLAPVGISQFVNLRGGVRRRRWNMTRLLMVAALTITILTPCGLAQERKDLTRVVVPDKKEDAIKVLKEWLEARGIDFELRKETFVLKRGGVLMNFTPIVHKGELDRLRVMAFYNAKPEFKGTKEFEQLAVKLNRAQNFLQVWIDDDGDLGAGSNLTFFDELSAHVFDAFIDAFAQIVKQHVLTPEAVKMLK